MEISSLLACSCGGHHSRSFCRTEQITPLGMGKWLEGNGEAIYDTTVSRRETLRGDGCNIAFTAKGSTLYAIADSDKPGEILIEGLTG